MFKTKSGRKINYFGSEFNNIIAGNNGIKSLHDMFQILLSCWCKETAYPSAQSDIAYNFENDPTYGQCAITATIVSDFFGGTIHKIKVDGGGTHYFNKINNKYIDMTSDQFELYNIPVSYEPNIEVKREFCNKNSNTLERYTLLKNNINKYLSRYNKL